MDIRCLDPGSHKLILDLLCDCFFFKSLFHFNSFASNFIFALTKALAFVNDNEDNVNVIKLFLHSSCTPPSSICPSLLLSSSDVFNYCRREEGGRLVTTGQGDCYEGRLHWESELQVGIHSPPPICVRHSHAVSAQDVNNEAPPPPLPHHLPLPCPAPNTR